MEPRQHRRQALVVACQAAKARGLGKAPFDHPAAWQEHKAMFGLRQLDNAQDDSVSLGRRGSGFAGVALIDIGQFHSVAGRRLHSGGQLLDLADTMCRLILDPHVELGDLEVAAKAYKKARGL